MDVKRYLPQKTPIGNVMKESPEGYWVLSNDFDRILAERDALQQLMNARDEEIERLKADSARLDFWQANTDYYGGFAPSGSWSFFNAQGKTCYGNTVREALDQLQVMHKDLENQA